jgi:hypothetical protein
VRFLSKVRVRKIVPKVPRDEADRAELLEDLQTMGVPGSSRSRGVSRTRRS